MFYELAVKSVTRETPDSVCVEFDVPEALEDAFRFTQGQNLTLIRDFNGEEIRRSYSICTGVNEGALKVGIKQVADGLFSTYANSELQAGDRLKVLRPTGHFYVDLDPTASRRYLAFAAGSGITPILSIIKSTLDIEPNSRFTLVYGNRTTETIMFLEELEGLKNQYMDRFRTIHVLSRETQNAEILNGRINAEKVKALLDDLINLEATSDAFLCGPFQMVQDARQELINAGMDAANIHTELFGTPDDLAAISSEKRNLELSEEEAGHLSDVRIILDDKGTDIQLRRGGESILDAALKVRKELPFACKGGVCATCRAKVVEGEVEMEINYSLTPEELEDGFVLTCQCHPISDKVVISYDEK